MHTFTTDNGKYTIVSYGNGWAYEVICNTTGDNLWFQDDDAHQLQTETDYFEHTCVIDQYFECLHG